MDVQISDDDDSAAEVPAWIVGFADLMTLLFATFVVLYGLKPEGETKAFRGAISSIKESFIEVPDDIPVEEKRGELILHKSKLVKKKGVTSVPKVVTSNDNTEFPIQIVNREMETLVSTLKVLSQEVPPVTVDNQSFQSFSFTYSETELSVSLLGAVYFSPRSHKVRKHSLKQMEGLISAVVDLKRPVHFAGHSSRFSQRDNYSGWELSAIRAASLAKYFEKNFGLKKKFVTAVGYGSERNRIFGTREENKYLNDRVEIKIDFGTSREP